MGRSPGDGCRRDYDSVSIRSFRFSKLALKILAIIRTATGSLSSPNIPSKLSTSALNLTRVPSSTACSS